MCEKLLIMCNSCQNILKEFDTSPIVTDVGKKRMVDINLRSVVATTSIGGGLTALHKVCKNFNFMQPVHEKPRTYGKLLLGNLSRMMLL